HTAGRIFSNTEYCGVKDQRRHCQNSNQAEDSFLLAHRSLSPLMISFLFFIRQSSLDHYRAFHTLAFHLASDIIGIGDGTVEFVRVGCASAAAVKFCETILAFFFG